ncbi:YbaB/EbfC family nucleoid-associated protein [Granulicatella sp. WM01]|nr:YbaB/EbfC family nucleoid-associated protein [Granulicatella sp. WM01]
MRGMGNMQGMMKQMQKLQKEMEKAQDYLNEQEFVGISTNDFVQVKMTGKKEVIDVIIKPEIVDPEDIDMLQDLLVVAMNDALKKVETRTQEVMGKYTQHLPF